MDAVTASGVFFLIIAIRDSDVLALSSAIAWLLGVGAFTPSRWGPWRGSVAGSRIRLSYSPFPTVMIRSARSTRSSSRRRSRPR